MRVNKQKLIKDHFFSKTDELHSKYDVFRILEEYFYTDDDITNWIFRAY